MVKKVKAPVLDVRKLLDRAKGPEEVIPKVRGNERAIDGLFDVMLDESRWDEGTVQMNAVEVLCALGRSDEVADAFLDLVRDLGLPEGHEDQGDDWDFVLGRIAVAVGEFADLSVGAKLIDALELSRVGDEDDALPAWSLVVEVLSTFAERGHDTERIWPWLERVRLTNPPVWCLHMAGCPDPRAVPLLQQMVDENAAAVDSDDGAVDIVVFAVEALRSLGAARPTDGPLYERAHERFRARMPPQPEKAPGSERR